MTEDDYWRLVGTVAGLRAAIIALAHRKTFKEREIYAQVLDAAAEAGKSFQFGGVPLAAMAETLTDLAADVRKGVP